MENRKEGWSAGLFCFVLQLFSASKQKGPKSLHCWTVSTMTDHYNININIMIGSIPTDWVRYFHFSFPPKFSSHQIGTVLSKDRPCIAHFAPPPPLPCSAVLLSCDSSALRAAVRETQVLLMTDAITDHGREKAQCSLELLLSLTWK